MKYIKRLLITAFVIGIIWVANNLMEPEEIKYTPSAPPPQPVITYTKAPALVYDLTYLGVNVNSINTNIAFGDTDKSCRMTGTTGCYTYEGIIVKPNLTKEEERVSVAHEYLHYVWSGGDHSMSPYLLQTYSKNSALYNRMQFYRDNRVTQETLINELHSIICTEMNDREMPYILLNHCRQYLPNRNALPSYY